MTWDDLVVGILIAALERSYPWSDGAMYADQAPATEMRGPGFRAHAWRGNDGAWHGNVAPSYNSVGDSKREAQVRMALRLIGGARARWELMDRYVTLCLGSCRRYG